MLAKNLPRELPEHKNSLDDPSLLINRELSWLQFNIRVLEEAQDTTHPTLERVKFLAICGSNLDEFFMTRIPRLLKKVTKGLSEKSQDGMTPFQQIEATRKEIIPLIEKHTRCWKDELLPALATNEILIKKVGDLPLYQKLFLRDYFTKQILPVLEKFKTRVIPNIHRKLTCKPLSSYKKTGTSNLPCC